MYFADIFFCLFCNFLGSKPTRTRTQNIEKQRNGLTKRNKLYDSEAYSTAYMVFLLNNVTTLTFDLEKQ
jgi:hypothetical protein